jgi:RHS repeat-associated protein
MQKGICDLLLQPFLAALNRHPRHEVAMALRYRTLHTHEYDYLGDDTQESQTTGSRTTDYLYDRAAGLPQVVDDGTTAYLHDVTGNLVSIDGSGIPTYPLQDVLGSVRLSVDDAGSALGTREWDAWGTLRTSAGSSYGFGWAGEQYDASSDLVYLRARSYSPGTASFLSRDTVQPNAGGTTGYNPYAYAGGDPVTFTDPSGHSFLDNCAGMGPFACLAYVFECFLSGNCLYGSEHGDSTAGELVRGTRMAGEWARLALERGVKWISNNWPTLHAEFPTIPISITCPWCVMDKLYDDLFGKDGLLDELGYETVGVCLNPVQFTGPGLNAELTFCAVKDTVPNYGVTVSLSGPAGLGFKNGSYTKGGFSGPKASITLGLLVSNSDTIFGLAGWSGNFGAGGFAEVGGGLDFSIIKGPDGTRTVTTQFEFGYGFGAAITNGASHTWVYPWDEVPDKVKDLFDEVI